MIGSFLFYIESSRPAKTSFSMVSDISIVLLILSAIILTGCIIGLIGSCYSKRLFLFSYEIFLIFFFSVHFVAFVLYMSFSTLIIEYIENRNFHYSSKLNDNSYHAYDNFKTSIITWNAVVLGVELFFVIATPFFIRRLSKKNQENHATVYSPIKRRDLQV